MYTNRIEQKKYGHLLAVIGTTGAMLLLPYLVHLIPPQGGVPMGARLLPIFYAPLLAVILIDLRTAIVAALVAPVLNYLIMGSPASSMVVLLTIEVVTFSTAAFLLYRRWPRLVINAPLAYLVALIPTALLLFVEPLIPVPPATFFVTSVTNAVPGILILMAINIVLVRFVSGQNVGKS